MKNISRFISLGLAAMTAFSMTACSSGGNTAPTQGGQPAQGAGQEAAKAPASGAVTTAKADGSMRMSFRMQLPPAQSMPRLPVWTMREDICCVQSCPIQNGICSQ